MSSRSRVLRISPTTASASAPPSAARAPATTRQPRPPAPVEPSTISARTPCFSVTTRAASRALSHVPDSPSAMWTETMSRPSSASGSKTARKSPTDGCDVTGSEGDSFSRA